MTRRALTASLLALTLAGTSAPALAQRNPVPNRGPVLIERGRPLPDSERAAFDAQNAYMTQQDLWRVMR